MRLGVYISVLEKLSIKRDFIVTIQGQAIPIEAVSVCETDSNVLQIDVERAWKDMALQPGWSNEVEVKLYFAIDH